MPFSLRSMSPTAGDLEKMGWESRRGGDGLSTDDGKISTNSCSNLLFLYIVYIYIYIFGVDMNVLTFEHLSLERPANG